MLAGHRNGLMSAPNMKRRILNILIALDQLLYVLVTLGHGHPDETLSAAAWRLEQKGHWAGRVFRPLLDALMWFDPQHCMKSYESEILRARALLVASGD